MIELLVTLLIAGLVLYVAYWILGMLPFPPQVKNIIMVILGVIFLIWLLQTVGGSAGLDF